MGAVEPSDRVVWALRRAFLAVESVKDSRLQEVGVSNAHYGVLVNVGRADGITSAEVARRLGVTPQNVATLVARLEERGWLSRRPHPRHGHVIELHLTRAGRRVLVTADAVVGEVEDALRTTLGAADAESLRALLERVVDRPPIS